MSKPKPMTIEEPERLQCIERDLRRTSVPLQHRIIDDDVWWLIAELRSGWAELEAVKRALAAKD